MPERPTNQPWLDTPPTAIAPDALHERLARGEPILVLDVREPHEYCAGHLRGSMLIPLDQLDERLAELPRNRTIVTVCRSGQRACAATRLLRRAGLDAIDLAGGVLLWSVQGLPLSQGSGAGDQGSAGAAEGGG